MAQSAERPPFISVVVPVYEAEDCIQELYRRLVSSISPISEHFEIIMIEDCGRDGSYGKIAEIARRDTRVRGFQFSRNFGQHYGLTAGMDLSRGQWVITMDCDLQDPPEEIPKLYAKAQEGYDVVLGKRGDRQDGFFKRISSMVFYRIFNYLTGVKYDHDIAGFTILSRRAVIALCALREQHRYFIALLQWIGFPTAKVNVLHARRHAGKTTYTLKKLFRLAFDAMIGYSNRPLTFSIKVGLGLSAVSFIAGAYMIYLGITGKTEVPGWASIIVSLYFLGGLLMANLGIIGLYVGRIMEQQRGRPLYIIRRSTEEAAPPESGASGDSVPS
jgi:glycosyltransferase involved in cell wall biosynthesis